MGEVQTQMGQALAVEAAKEPEQSFSIVILGAMNPRIHHPLWYQQHNLISDAETAEATSEKNELIVLPQLAQFTASGINIICQQARWDIRTNLMSLRARIMEMAARIFDELLPETPVNLYAFNNDFHLKTKVPQVKQAISGRLASAGFQLSLPRIEAASLILSHEGPDKGQVNIRIEGSNRSPSEVFVGTNANHPVTTAGKFNIRPMLDRDYDADFQSAKLYADNVVKLIDGD